MESWEIQELIFTVAASLAVLIPITGLTLRFGLKPFLRDLAELRAARRDRLVVLEDREGDRLAQIEGQIDTLERSVRHLTEVVQFDRQLKPGTGQRAEPTAE